VRVTVHRLFLAFEKEAVIVVAEQSSPSHRDGFFSSLRKDPTPGDGIARNAQALELGTKPMQSYV
jgi:hypothetical protein